MIRYTGNFLIFFQCKGFINLRFLVVSLILPLLVPLSAYAQSATFYSNNFVGRKMANGQTYHHGKYVAAHPSLPLGSRVKVTNRRTGKSVIVTISDRCNCSIDLSRSAFQAIASPKKGRVPVSITRL
ncbi:MAG: rare lipoprotein [Cyanobacteriota bacterium]